MALASKPIRRRLARLNPFGLHLALLAILIRVQSDRKKRVGAESQSAEDATAVAAKYRR